MLILLDARAGPIAARMIRCDVSGDREEPWYKDLSLQLNRLNLISYRIGSDCTI